jgi:hypothetical protein
MLQRRKEKNVSTAKTRTLSGDKNLRAELVELGDTIGQVGNRNVVAKFVTKLGGFLTRSLHLKAAVRQDAGGDTSDLFGHGIDARHRRRVQQFVRHFLLRHQHGAVRTSHRHRRLIIRFDRLERVLNLVQTSFLQGDGAKRKKKKKKKA